MIVSKKIIIPDGYDIDTRIVVDRDEQLIQIVKWCNSLHDSSGRVLFVTGCSGSGKTLLVNGAKKILEKRSDYLSHHGINGPFNEFEMMPFNLIKCDPEIRLRNNALSLLKSKKQFNSAGVSAFGFGISAGWNILYQQAADDFWSLLQKTYNTSPFVIAFDTSIVENHQYWDIDIKNLIEDANNRAINLNIIVVTTEVPQTQEGIIKNSDIIHLDAICRELVEKYICCICEIHNVEVPNSEMIIDEYLSTGDFRYLNKSLNSSYVRQTI